MTTSPNVPATTDEHEPVDREAERPPKQDVTVALLPLALISFLIASFVAVAWTFFAAG